MRRPGGELHDGDVGACLGQPRLVLGKPEEVQRAGIGIRGIIALKYLEVRLRELCYQVPRLLP